MDTPDRARTPLLALISAEAMDRDYHAAASRRAAREAQAAQAASGSSAGLALRRTAASRTAVVAVVGVFALLVTVAAVQTSRNADADSASRESLIERIHARRDVVGELQGRIAQLKEANTDAEAQYRRLGERLTDLQTRHSELGALTGFAVVTGPGVRITVDNSPYATLEGEMIHDADLTLLVNALWAGGAEAIAINGQRLTAKTAIRTSGKAIEVNGSGIAPPYAISAIGDRSTLAANLLDTSSGLQFNALKQQYGWTQDSESVAELRLPSAPASRQRLRSAEQLAPKPGTTEGGGRE